MPRGTRFDADVVVVGAGPAGATAARALALGGARVKMLERHHFPRNKPCGGGITMRALGRFPHLRPALPRITTHTVSRLLLEGPGGDNVTIESPEPAVLLVRRVEFDHLLARLACEAGAELVEGAAVSQAAMDDTGVELIARDGRTFSAPIVIAADGVHSVVARRLDLNRGWPPAAIALDMMEETPNEGLRTADPGLLWVSYGHGSSDGYAYIFPKRDHVNIGIGYLLSYFRERDPGPPYEVQRRLVEALRERGIVNGQSSRAHFTPFLIPVGGPLRETARGRVLLAGDAGGFVNGYTAEGIYYAMVSGELAAKAILAEGATEATGGAPTPSAAAPPASARNLTTVPRGQDLAGVFVTTGNEGGKGRPARRARRRDHPAVARYVAAWRREIGAELRDSVLIRKYLFRESRRVDAVVRGAKTHPLVADMIVAYATGTVSYRAARRRLLSQFPRVAWRLVKIALFDR